MFTITKPRRKLKKLLTVTALLLLLGVVVPGIYSGMSAVGAMSLFASGDSVNDSVSDSAATQVPTEVGGASEVPLAYTAEYAGETENAEILPDNLENAANTELGENNNVVENAANAVNSTDLPENAEISDNSANVANTENVTNAENMENVANADNAENVENAEKSGLWQSLLTVLFGETPEIVRY
jgi:hypothetical protein